MPNILLVGLTKLAKISLRPSYYDVKIFLSKAVRHFDICIGTAVGRSGSACHPPLIGRWRTSNCEHALSPADRPALTVDVHNWRFAVCIGLGLCVTLYAYAYAHLEIMTSYQKSTPPVMRI